jgi:hypothetical protein
MKIYIVTFPMFSVMPDSVIRANNMDVVRAWCKRKDRVEGRYAKIIPAKLRTIKH